MDAKTFDLDENQMDEYGQLIQKFIQENDEQYFRESFLKKEFEQADLMEKLTKKENEKEISRRVQGQVIRRIPGYDFFEPFKHNWRNCITHGKNMTAKHMLEGHLFGETGNWQGKIEKILKYVGETAKPFYSKTQKSMKESAQKLAKRIKQLIQYECEPFKSKKKIQPMQ